MKPDVDETIVMKKEKKTRIKFYIIYLFLIMCRNIIRTLYMKILFFFLSDLCIHYTPPSSTIQIWLKLDARKRSTTRTFLSLFNSKAE